MSTELVPATQIPPPALASVLGITPGQLVAQASELSTTITRALREGKMTQKFGTGEHVKIEGWQFTGSLLGFVAREKSVTELADGSFLAESELFCPATGKVFTHASGYCGVDEPTWKSKPKYARRGMAITRSINRVYANNFRWLIHMAGFKTTPAEEMTDVGLDVRSTDDRGEPLDPENKDHKAGLWKRLKEKGIGPADGVEIFNRMKGKYPDEFDDVMREYLADASRI